VRKAILIAALLLLFSSLAFAEQTPREKFLESFQLSYTAGKVSLKWNSYSDAAKQYGISRKGLFVDGSFKEVGKTAELSFEDSVDRQAYLEAYARLASQRLGKPVTVDDVKTVQVKYFYKIDVFNSSGTQIDESYPKTILIAEDPAVKSEGEVIQTQKRTAAELQQIAEQERKSAAAAAATQQARVAGTIEKIAGLAATAGESSAELGWIKYEHANLKFLRVFYSENRADLEGDYAKVANQRWVAFEGATSFIVDKLEAGKTYFFRLAAFDASNVVLAESDIVEAVTEAGKSIEATLVLEPQMLELFGDEVAVTVTVTLPSDHTLLKEHISVKSFEGGKDVAFEMQPAQFDLKAGVAGQTMLTFNKADLVANKAYLVFVTYPTGTLQAKFETEAEKQRLPFMVVFACDSSTLEEVEIPEASEERPAVFNVCAQFYNVQGFYFEDGSKSKFLYQYSVTLWNKDDDIIDFYTFRKAEQEASEGNVYVLWPNFNSGLTPNRADGLEMPRGHIALKTAESPYTIDVRAKFYEKGNEAVNIMLTDASTKLDVKLKASPDPPDVPVGLKTVLEALARISEKIAEELGK